MPEGATWSRANDGRLGLPNTHCLPAKLTAKFSLGSRPAPSGRTGGVAALRHVLRSIVAERGELSDASKSREFRMA